MKIYKVIFLSVLLTITLVGCAQESKPGYSVTVDIEGLENAKGFAYLHGAVRNGKQVSDSVPVNNGHFQFKGLTEEPVKATIWFQSKYQVKANSIFEFFLDNSSVKISGLSDTTRLLNLQNGKIIGSRIQDEYNKILEDANMVSGLDKLNEAYKTAWANKDTATMAVLRKSSKECYVKFDDFINNYTRANPKSFACLYILSDKMNPRDEESLKKLQTNIAALDASIASSVAGKNILDQIAFYLRGFIIGKQVSDFTQVDKDGNVVKLSDYRGKYLLLDFWASWCSPCRAENPNVLKAYNEYHPKGLEIVAVSLDTKKEAWLKAIAADKLPWTQISDLKNNNEVASQFGVNAIPDNFLIDPTGKVIARGLRGTELFKKLAEVIN